MTDNAHHAQEQQFMTMIEEQKRSKHHFSSKDKDKKTKTPKDPKLKTFNRLDPRFQWHAGLDENYVYPEEKEMVDHLRQHFGSNVNDLSDKFLLYFLFSRRHNMEQTKELLTKYLSKRKELGFDQKPLTLDDAEMMLNGTTLPIKGCHDKYDRMVMYYRMKYDEPKQFTLKQKYAALFWETRYRCETETIRYLRNGLVIIVDMDGFGWKNMDMSSEGKEFFSALNGLFPRRVRSLCALNGGALLKVAMKAAKLVMSKKMLKRVDVVDLKQVRELIPPQHLLEEYGGSLKMSFNDVVRQMRENDQC